MVDSSLVVRSVFHPLLCQCQSVAAGAGVMDTILAIAMAVIAVANIGLTFFIFKQGRKDTSDGVRKQRKFELIQTLILNNRLHLLYDFYDAISAECIKLQESTDQKTKMMVNEANKGLLKKFRQDFIMPFKVVDRDLFCGLKETADELVDSITEAIFDEGINLKHEPKFNEMISEPLALNRNAMLNKLCEMASLED